MKDFYVTDIYYAIDHNYTAQLKDFYNNYTEFMVEQKKTPKEYDIWLEEYVQQLKKSKVESIKEIIKYYVYIEDDDYAFIRHEDWSSFMRELEKIIPENSRKPYNNLGAGFEVHFDIDCGLGISIKEVFGMWMKPEEILDYYEKVVEPYRCM